MNAGPEVCPFGFDDTPRAIEFGSTPEEPKVPSFVIENHEGVLPDGTNAKEADSLV
jgi:hypothetical protein